MSLEFLQIALIKKKDKSLNPKFLLQSELGLK